MPLLELKPLTLELLPAALQLDQRCFGGLWTIDGYQREVESPNSELLVLQAGPTNRVLEAKPDRERPDSRSAADISPPEHSPLLGLGGYWAILEEAHITILAIEPDYQRQGLGLALLSALLQSACTRGLERATLEVRISNQSALALYKKFGFQEAGRRRKYYQDTGEDALILWRGDLQSPHFQRLLENERRSSYDRLIGSGWQIWPWAFVDTLETRT